MKESLPKKETDLSELVDNYNHASENHIGDLQMDLWRMGKLLELLGDDWTYESAIYDLTYFTASLYEFYQRCSKNPQKQYLIPVDFHH